MRKNIQRIMSLVLILLMLIPSMVMAEQNISIDYIQNNNDVTISVNSIRNRSVSITIKGEAKYYYINQGVTDDLGKIEFKTTLDLDKTYNCQVKVDDKIATIEIVMKNTSNPEEPKDEKVDLYIKGYKGVILDEKNIIISNNETVLNLTTRILSSKGIEYENINGYIASIDNQSQLDRGEGSGWMYSVNGIYPNVGAGLVSLKNGDSIKWLYTENLGQDIGAPMPSSSFNISDLNKIIEETLKIINNKNSTEKEIVEAIQKLLDYFGDVTANLTSGDIKSIEEFAKISSENMGIILNSIGVIKDKNAINKIIDKILDISIKVEDKLSKINEDSNRNIKKSVKINAVEQSGNISESVLSKLFLERAMIKKVESIKILSNQALIEIAPDFIGKDIKEDIKIRFEKSKGAVNIKLEQAERELNILENPLKITLDYDTDIRDKNNLTVALIEEDGTRSLMGGVYEQSAKSIKFLTNKFGEFRIEENKSSFKDLTNYKWAEEAINSMTAKGIVNGSTLDKFAPADNITRAQFSALISRMLKYNEALEGSLAFKDVNKDKWYYKSISAVYREGLINGKSALNFDPEGYITREEMSKIIGEILMKNSYKKQDEITLTKFSDGSTIASWAKEGSAITIHNGIIKGSDGKFNPKANATRAEAALMLYRLYELIMK